MPAILHTLNLLTELMTYEYKNHPLPILVSARVRLTDEQRKKVKDAYYAIKNATAPSTRTNENGLVVETPYSAPDLDKALGMSSLVFADLTNSRDTLTLGIVMKLQDVLGVELITEKELIAACKNYAAYMFRKED